jgi:hypothetical protein
MKHAQSPIMDRIAKIENCVLGGFVLDDRGNWVSIADKQSSEEDFLVRLEAGRVLHNGHWVTFENAKKPVGPQPAHSSGPVAETDDHYPPETKSIHFQTVEPGSADVSSYATETGLIVIGTTAETVQPRAFQSETKPGMDALSGEDVATEPKGKKSKRMPAFVPPSIPTWEKDESRQKNRALIIGGVILAAIGIAVIALIVLQVVRLP